MSDVVDDPVAGHGAVERLVAHILNRLGPPDTWRSLRGYPDSLALCVVDSIWSPGVRYGSVCKVVQRYRRVRLDQGGDPDRDGVVELLDVIDGVGGGSAFARLVANQQKVSTAPGAVRKAEAVSTAARVLYGAGIADTGELRKAMRDGRAPGLRSGWLRVPGQGSGITWSYLLMLAGLEEVKPDRMVRRFVATALDVADVAPSVAADLVAQAATCLGVSLTTLDHAIWTYQRRQPPAR